jgi:signal transduction histidine kinase
MAVTTIAFTAAAGALALALSTTVLSWRMRLKLSQSKDVLKSDLDHKHLVLGELDAATQAFDEAFLAVEGNVVRLVWGEETLKTCAEALGLKAVLKSSDQKTPGQDSAPLVIEAIGETSHEAAEALAALITEGKSCRFEVFAEAAGGLTYAKPSGITLVVEGRSSGATAWIRLAIASTKTSLSSGPFARMADLLPYPCWICANEGQMVWANAAWLKAVNAHSLDQARNDHLGLDRSADALVNEALSSNQRREGFRWLTLNGQRRAFSVIAEPISEGYVCGYAIDVTEAEDSREALKRHAKAHDDTLDHLEDAVAIFGPEKRLTFHNRAFETLWDLEAAWLSERPTHGELLERLRQKRKLPETSDFAKWKQDELEFYDLTEAAPDDMWSLPNGRSLRVVRQPHPLGGLLVLFSDKTGELSLKAQFNSLIQVQRATLDQLSDAVSVFGSDGRLRLRNAAFDRFWGLSSDEINTQIDFSAMAELCIPLVHDRGFWADLKGRVTDTDPVARAPQSGEIKLSDGRLSHWRTQPLPDGATLVAFSDITTRRALEVAITERDQALNESVRLKREFVGNVSYELRTPLTTIVGYAELLQRQNGLAQGHEPKDIRNRNYLNAVQAAAKELARSIDDVLDMAQIDAGEMSASLSDFNLARMVAAALGRHADAFSAKAIQFDYKGLSPQSLVRADQRRLGQVLDHLLDYAVRNAQTEGRISVQSRKGGDTLCLEIGYTGRGIAYHTQAHIFDRYVGRERGGPGIGLALVKALVELHEGWITLESEPHTGATFAIHLPRQSEVGLEEDEPQALTMPLFSPEIIDEIDETKIEVGHEVDLQPEPNPVLKDGDSEDAIYSPIAEPVSMNIPIVDDPKTEAPPSEVMKPSVTANALGLSEETLLEAKRILGMA